MTSRIPARLSGHEFRDPGDVAALRQSLSEPYRPHWHDFHEIALVTGGHGTHRVDDRSATLAPGDVLAVSPSSLHAVAPAPGSCLELVDVTFDAHTLPAEVAPLLASLTAYGDPVVARPGGSADGLFHALVQESTPGLPYRQIAARALVAQLVVTLVRDRGGTNPGPTPLWLTSVLDHIERHYARPLPTSELAAVAHLSPPYLRERFRLETGRTLTAHVQHVRLRTARALLATTGLSVSQVRRASGFGDASHFARAFRAAAGCSPTAYRQRAARQRRDRTQGTSPR